MDEPDKLPEGVSMVRARRISTADGAEPPVDEQVGVIRESAVTIDVDGLHSFTVMCTPQDTKALAVGFLYSEGVVEDLSEIVDIAPDTDHPDVVHVKLTGKVAPNGSARRNLLIVSSCGACGGEDLERRIDAIPGVADGLRIDGSLVRRAIEQLCESHGLFEASGGAHSACVFDDRGEILTLGEDAGRHNALDKAIGKCLLNGIPTAGRGVALSGRVSLEMVGKCANAGIELIAAISAPTSLAVDVAERWNITLCAFVRETRATIFTHPARVTTVR